MRDIEFRGKHTDSGLWVYGYVAEISTYGVTGHRIAVGIYEKPKKEFDGDWWEVDPSTVGQYTGLKDKNGTKIFEGDIVKCVDANNGGSFTAIVSFGNPNYEYNWGFQLVQIGGDDLNTDILLWVDMEEAGAYIEVISNIYDNPELLGGKEDDLE